MARIFGKSGAWRSLCDDLWNYNIWLKRPDQIGPLLRDLQEHREEIILRQRQKSLKARQSIEAQIADLEEQRAEIIRRQHLESLKVRQPIEARIAALLSERNALKRIMNFFRILRLRRAVEGLKNDERRYIERLDSNIELRRLRTEVETLELDERFNIDRLVRCIQRLQEASTSPELGGAQAELLVSEALSHLSDDYCVFHDVRLRAGHYIRFNGRGLKSAQVDHLVLGPACVFVIETKNWSAETSQSGEHFSPFEQVERASYLCYRLLRDTVPQIHVRSIIVKLSSLPAPPPGAKVKVLEKHKLCSHITSFKDRNLDATEIEQVRRCITEYMAQP